MSLRFPTGEQYGIGIAKANPELKTAIDEALQKITDSGEYKTIYMKWFGVEPATK